jgi:Flp pilus assembly pilin Flp
MPPRVEHALMLTLLAARIAALVGQWSWAVTLLRTFAFEVRGVKRAKRVPAGTADALIARAVEVMGTLDTLYTSGQTPAKQCDGFSTCSP